MRPNLFILGAQKAGTTSLYTYLASHPEVFMCPLKEPHYFVRHRLQRPQIVPSEAAYLRYFSRAGNARYAGEASAHYFTEVESPALLHAFNREAQVIIVLRKPEEALPALHHEECFVGRERRAFVDALEDYACRYRAWPQQLKRWQELFGQRVQVLFFEDLKADPAGLYAGVLAWLGLAAHVPEFVVHNKAKALPPLWRARLSSSRAVVEAVRQLHRVPALALALDGVRKNRVVYAPRLAIGVDVRGRLLALTDAATLELAAITGRDLSAWRPA